MADAMVTGRMPQAKKQAGGRVLQSLGLSASQVINQLYDYLITYDASPFDAMANEPAKSVQLEEALTFARSLPRKNQFSHMPGINKKINFLISSEVFIINYFIITNPSLNVFPEESAASSLYLEHLFHLALQN